MNCQFLLIIQDTLIGYRLLELLELFVHTHMAKEKNRKVWIEETPKPLNK
jgi:hypothetical protein